MNSELERVERQRLQASPASKGVSRRSSPVDPGMAALAERTSSKS